MNILITAIGSFSADCVVSSLKRHGHKVIGCDVYPPIWHPVSKDCDTVYQVPLAKDESAYIDVLVDICDHEQISSVFPLTDLEIDVLNCHRDVFIQREVQLCIQSESCLSLARDKHALSAFFENDSHVNIPLFASSLEITDKFPLPAIAKPINGRSSEGLQKISTQEDLLRIRKMGNYIIQEYLTGNVYTVDYVRDNKGNDFSVPREELLRTKNGAGTTVRITPDSELMETVSYIGEKIGVLGCVNMEFIANDGKYYLIDINPRFSAGVAFSNTIGYDFVISHLACFFGETIEKGVSFGEQIIAKRYREEILKK